MKSLFSISGEYLEIWDAVGVKVHFPSYQYPVVLAPSSSSSGTALKKDFPFSFKLPWVTYVRAFPGYPFYSIDIFDDLCDIAMLS